MSRPVLAFTLGMAVITLAAAIVIAKAQVNANISYGWILTAPWVVPTLLTISFLLFFMALREWRGFRKGFWRVVTFIVPPYSSMDGEERPKDKAQQSAPVPILLPD